jgi:thymidylate synthase
MRNVVDQAYYSLVEQILLHGQERTDRTGTGTLSIFGYNTTIYVGESFPILTTKKIPFKSTAQELLWFLSGSCNVNDLPKTIQPWWSPWADTNGDLGPLYGKQFTRPNSIVDVVENIKKDPFSRRHVFSTWNLDDLPQMKLAPCHGTVVQFYVNNNGTLDCHMYQRSADVFLGLPINISSYSLLLCMVAKCTNYTPGKLVLSFGDLHIYKNHLSQINEQIFRSSFPLPKLEIADKVYNNVTDFTIDDFTLVDYQSHPAIKGELSI